MVINHFLNGDDPPSYSSTIFYLLRLHINEGSLPAVRVPFLRSVWEPSLQNLKFTEVLGSDLGLYIYIPETPRPTIYKWMFGDFQPFPM